MNMVQGDCKCGALAFVAGEDLSAATGLLVKLSPAGKVVKPAAVSDIAPYVVACGAFEGYLCGVSPMSSVANCRVVLKGACQPGSLLVSVGDGRVEAGTLSGSAGPVGVAEETGVEGQRVLLRPMTVGARGVAGAAGANGAPGAVGSVGAAGAVGATGLAGGTFNIKASEMSGLTSSAWPACFGKVLFLNDGAWLTYAPSPGNIKMAAVIAGVVDAVAADPVYIVRTVMEMSWAEGRYVTLPLAVINGGVSVGSWVDMYGMYNEGEWFLHVGAGGGPMGANSLKAVSATGPEILLVVSCYV